MGADDIIRIMAGLADINTSIAHMGERVASLEARVDELDKKIDKYNGLKDRVAVVEGEKRACEAAIDEIRANCKAVQDNKAKTRIPWQNIIPSVITGLVMIIAGAVMALILK